MNMDTLSPEAMKGMLWAKSAVLRVPIPVGSSNLLVSLISSNPICLRLAGHFNLLSLMSIVYPTRQLY